jgi:[ribosomal protein S5]-alanine N-acetyltransferase
VELTTDRLILRDFVEDDWPAVLAYQSDPRYLRYYEWTHRTAEEVQEFIGWFLRAQAEQPRIRFQLAVVLKANGQLIGNCGIRKAAPDARQADIGYELAPDYWGNGYATEAARAVVHFGFTQLRVHRIHADCVADNLASARVLEKIGMTLEGCLRENQYYKGRWWDTLLYAMLESDWRTTR